MAWDKVRLIDCCAIRPQKKEAKDILSGSDDVSFVPMKNLASDSKDLALEQTKKLDQVYSGYTYFADGDVLLAKITPCFENGKLGIASGLINSVGFGSSEFVVYRPKNNLDSEYLYYYLSQQSVRDEGASLMTGAVGHKRIPKEFYENIEIPIPPLEEQKKIVEILDPVFADIDKARANAQQNLNNARELFDSYLNRVFSQRGEGWKEKLLQDIADDFGRGRSRHRPRNDESLFGGKYPFIQTGDVRNSNHKITTYSKTYNDKGLAQSKLWPKGTICVTIAANIAETGVLEFDSCFPDSVIGIVVNNEYAVPSYVEYLLQFSKTILQAQGKGSAQDNINLGTFEKMYFPFPSIKAQKEIVESLSFLSKSVSALEEKYSQKLNKLEELKKSILQKAFSGELV